jgi:DNA-binding protein YbaB
MFDKLKQLQKIRDLQKSLEREKIEVEKNGVKIVINGTFKIEEINLNPDLTKDEQEKTLEECFNEATVKLQQILAKKMLSL